MWRHHFAFYVAYELQWDRKWGKVRICRIFMFASLIVSKMNEQAIAKFYFIHKIHVPPLQFDASPSQWRAIFGQTPMMAEAVAARLFRRLSSTLVAHSWRQRHPFSLVRPLFSMNDPIFLFALFASFGLDYSAPETSFLPLPSSRRIRRRSQFTCARVPEWSFNFALIKSEILNKFLSRWRSRFIGTSSQQGMISICIIELRTPLH